MARFFHAKKRKGNGGKDLNLFAENSDGKEGKVPDRAV